MCNWRSVFPPGFTPHTPHTAPSSPHPILASLPSQHPLLLLLGWSLLLLSPSRWSFSCPAPSLLFFFFFFFCRRSLRRHKITEAVLTSLSAWPNTLPFSSLPPPPLLLLHSGIHHTLVWASHTWKKLIENKYKIYKTIMFFSVQQTGHDYITAAAPDSHLDKTALIVFFSTQWDNQWGISKASQCLSWLRY